MRIEHTDSANQIKQGDFLHWKGATDPFHRYAIVVTADCDLSRGKHWGRITVVPVLSVEDYCTHLVAPRILESLKARLTKTLGEEIAIAQRAPSQSANREVASAELILLDDEFEAHWTDHPQIVKCCRVLRDIQGAQHYSNARDCLKDGLEVLGYNSAALAERVASSLSSPPGDVLFIPAPSILGLDFGVAWLRVVREVSDAQLVKKLSEWSPGKAMRVARLGPIFRYRLTQRLAQVFSDIGLPEDYEADLKQHIEHKAREFGQQ